MSKAILSLETINKVMQLLGSLPYQDVAEVIDMVRKDVQVIEDDSSPEEPTSE